MLAAFVALGGYLLRPGHLLPGSVDVEFQLEGFAFVEDLPAEKAVLCAVMSVKNNSGHTIWYRGVVPGVPDTLISNYVDGRWDGVRNSYDPPSEVQSLYSGGSFVFFAPVRENAVAAKVGFEVASSWLDDVDKVVLSEEFKVRLPRLGK
jgi:hypothetical protein